MPATATISNTLVQDSIIRAVRNVCASLLKQEARFVEKAAVPAYPGFDEKPHIFCNVGFVGQINGIVYLCLPDDFAQSAAARALGLTADEVRQGGYATTKDVMGELTNMTVGSFKSALSNLGFSCKLTLPTLVRGEGLSVCGLKGAERHIFHFDCAGHRLIADVQLKQET